MEHIGVPCKGVRHGKEKLRIKDPIIGDEFSLLYFVLLSVSDMPGHIPVQSGYSIVGLHAENRQRTGGFCWR
ncbi:MAG: hypothetical protein A2101_01260 [Spirochaetes bacterium GWF2_52_7]|nr:MAG: hypothetical protein A2101_01260 [Spirochaetes bacterium GWF2_52_7]